MYLFFTEISKNLEFFNKLLLLFNILWHKLHFISIFLA
jgi:hypothetical protein